LQSTKGNAQLVTLRLFAVAVFSMDTAGGRGMTEDMFRLDGLGGAERLGEELLMPTDTQVIGFDT